MKVEDVEAFRNGEWIELDDRKWMSKGPGVEKFDGKEVAVCMDCFRRIKWYEELEGDDVDYRKSTQGNPHCVCPKCRTVGAIIR